jgi:hypothetical protein
MVFDLEDDMNNMHSGAVGVFDAKAIIEMNNLAVGYFPSDMPEIGVYPPPIIKEFLPVVPSVQPTTPQETEKTS